MKPEINEFNIPICSSQCNEYEKGGVCRLTNFAVSNKCEPFIKKLVSKYMDKRSCKNCSRKFCCPWMQKIGAIENELLTVLNQVTFTKSTAGFNDTNLLKTLAGKCQFYLEI